MRATGPSKNWRASRKRRARSGSHANAAMVAAPMAIAAPSRDGGVPWRAASSAATVVAPTSAAPAKTRALRRAARAAFVSSVNGSGMGERTTAGA